MEAIALHDFHATADDELSFKKGSILKVILFVASVWDGQIFIGLGVISVPMLHFRHLGSDIIVQQVIPKTGMLHNQSDHLD